MNRLCIIAGLGLLGIACADTCDELDDEAWQCGDIGDLGPGLYYEDWGSPWPPVVTSQGDILVSEGGSVFRYAPPEEGALLDSGDWHESPEEEGRVAHRIQAPVAQAADGSIYVVGQDDDWDNSRNLTSKVEDGLVSWTSPHLPSGVVRTVTPAGDRAYVSTGSGDAADVKVLSAADGTVLDSWENTDRVLVSQDGSLRMLTDYADGHHGSLQARDADGTPRWSYDAAAGLVHLALGPAGSSLVVTRPGALQRVSESGAVEWTYTPDCAPCAVGAAPVVTADRAYVPVWPDAGGSKYCADGGRQSDAPEELHGVDLATGALAWTFTGYSLAESPFLPRGETHDPWGNPIGARKWQAGRPVVATDGSMFMLTSGTLLRLDAQGVEVGRLMYGHEGGWDEPIGVCNDNRDWYLPRGQVHTPVLGPEGTLWFPSQGWGSGLGTVRTGATPADIPWVAPDGDPRNSGHAGG